LDILFYKGIRIYTYKALKDTELLVLNKQLFKQLFFSEFREIGEDFLKSARSRKRKTNKFFKEGLTFCEQHFRSYHPEYTDKTIERRLKKKTLLNLTGLVIF